MIHQNHTQQFTPPPHIAGCTGKRSFATQKQAARRAKLMRRKYAEPLTEYFCRHCNRWHIGGNGE
ncbi:hypothetical protein SAMN04489859_100881 [Paracoccus alcaliphilus]|uniref:Uncharacterized protein n=1 Tax=Paracoccus alcaliphilus TaxID=34002 RepID=A0A1H8H2B9_9RHOB|nr:hypothetical protein [Paracoccus alcaliphilus]SEN50275.1 hypothetical protein SAMN04489859_100881 [Paracoccus alcaliphilus]